MLSSLLLSKSHSCGLRVIKSAKLNCCNSLISSSGNIKTTNTLKLYTSSIGRGFKKPINESTTFSRYINDTTSLYGSTVKLFKFGISNKINSIASKIVQRSPLFLTAIAPSLLLAAGYTLQLSPHTRLFLTAQCKAKSISLNRLQGNENEDDSKKKDPKFQWKLFFKLLWQDIFFLLGAVLASIGAAMVNILIPGMLGDITNIVSKYAADSTADISNFMRDVQEPSVKLVILYGIQGFLTFSYISLLSVVGENVAGRFRKQLFHSLLQQDIDFFDTHKTGELVDRLTSDVQEFKSAFKLTISQGIRATTQTIGCIGSLLVISTKLTFVMLGIIPVVVLTGSLLGAGLRKLSRDSQQQIAKSTAVADEALGNVRTVRAFAMEKKEYELYEAEVNKSGMLNIRLGVGIGAFQGCANIFLNGIVLGSLFGGGQLISMNQLKAGDLISFLVASQMIERSMAQLSLLFGHMIRGLSAGARVQEFIIHPAKICLHGGKKIPFHAFVGDIEFSNVDFQYPSRPGQNILKDFNLKIKGGQMVALVGLSGGGKSTLASLLERFYDVSAGNITLDGINLQDLDPTWLRGQAIGFINQEPVLFATSVMENIRYGKPGATDQEVKEAAKLANAHSFIENFPAGYKTVLGERGVTVSGGQKQRIAIARALIKNPSILILDEATSALDAESERVVQEALDKVVKGRTTVVIAHRLSTIRDADMIAVVSKGKIMEIGTHSELKNKKGLYWDLIKKQELEDDMRKK